MPQEGAGTVSVPATPVSAPPTPGTPGGPLISSQRIDSLSYDRMSMPRCKCVPVTAPMWSTNPHTCSIEFSVPDVSFTRKGNPLI
ncbi:hypothetical protein Patl1_05640 [Pistacia atlantica]|uniref:Uncharacterized protein n=1 Tax=Pistacia atlantica TaxID=434234 RepID=A0ACC1BRM5_9ROSI|nr:hypothetical protein Patl1_05640 [Pistacia atlantica]